MADERYLKDNFSDLLVTDADHTKNNGGRKEAPKNHSTKSGEENKYSQHCWVDIFKPTGHKDRIFVVNSRKHGELRDLILSRVRKPSVIVLSGPSGCGKNTALNVICSEENLKLIDCSSMSVDPGHGERDENQFSHKEDMYEIFERLMDENILFTSGFDHNNQISIKSPLFCFSNISQYFLKDPFKFLQILKKIIVKYGVPLAIVCGNAAQDCIFIKQLTNILQDKIPINVVNFKPITTKSLCTFADSIMKMLKIKPSQWITSDVVEEKAIASGGDIRNFILELQFTFLSLARRCKRRKSASFQDQIDQLSKVCTKDDRLSLYHCVGKVLYCKRTEDDDRCFLPDKFSHLYRQYSEFKISDLLNRLSCDYKIFSATLFENMNHFFTDIDELTHVYDDICLSDTLSTYWNENPSILAATQHTAIFIFVQSIVFWRAHQFASAKYSFRPFSVPTNHLNDKFSYSDERYFFASRNNNVQLSNFFNRKKLILDGFENQFSWNQENVDGNRTTKNDQITCYSDSEDIDMDSEKSDMEM